MMQIDVVGYLAAGLVFATFWARSMSSLRGIAIASNLAFIAYGYIGDLMPVLLLHLLLLPMNVLRLAELRNQDRPGNPYARTMLDASGEAPRKRP